MPRPGMTRADNLTRMEGNKRVSLLFIGGFGRSGSTLLECLLARLDSVVVLGEVEHLWERGVQQDQLCACGQPFSRCEFWVEVGQTAFGGWDRVRVERVLALKSRVARQRHLFRTLRRRLPQTLAEDAAEFDGYHRAIYEAAATITGAQVVVDSSKFPPLAVSLAHDPALDLRMMHLVRDSRGVSYSWSKTVTRPETADLEEMPRYSPLHSSIHWISHNVAMHLVRRLGRPVARMRYEDLVAQPATTVSAAWRELDLPGAGELPMVDAHTIDLLGSHSVAGNPMRFRRGATELRSDDAWRTAMPGSDRRIVTLLCAPLLLIYGYGLTRGRVNRA